MQISYNWLKEYAGFTHDPHSLATLLTDCGLEVEGLEKRETVRGGLQGVVTAQVLSCERHPEADRLFLTTVDAGQDKPLSIVCGAPNVAAGQKVVVALVGSTLYTPKGELKIHKARIRGQLSEGMICAEDELGLGDSHQGIMVLPPQTPAGMPAAEYFQLSEDWVYEIGLTPNRIDAASHLGVARDIVAVINHRHAGQQLSVLWPETGSFAPDENTLSIPVVIEDPQACPRYASLSIRGVSVSESPGWLKKRLLSVGLKPVNNVVDVTNFVLHELGQPLHAFDAAAIRGGRVVVKKPPKGTVFETLENQKLELTGHELMICNAEEPMCMGGIVGGSGSGVTSDTTDVFLESAYFDPVSIRRSSRHHGLKTEASFRFERGADLGMTLFALKRAAILIREVAGGRIASDVLDVYPNPIEPALVDLSISGVRRLIGQDIPVQEMKHILFNLDFHLLEESQDLLRLRVPAYRVDVTRPADVAEEILRIYGYNQVDIPSKMHSSMVSLPCPDKEQMSNLVSDMLSARGFREIMNNSLTRASYYQGPGFDASRSVDIVNPLSQDLNVMRQSLLFGGLEALVYNQNRQVADMKCYEFGNVYAKDPHREDPRNPLSAYAERMMLSLFLTGRRQPESWQDTDSATGFFDLKASVNAIIHRMGIDGHNLTHDQITAGPVFEYGLGLSFREKFLGSLGLLSAGLSRRFGLRQPVFFAGLEWDVLAGMAAGTGLRVKEVPRFPEMRRDLALLLDKEVSFAAVRQIALANGGEYLRRVGLFDVYEDEAKLGAGKKSYAVSHVFLNEERTLTDAEADRVMDRLGRAYEKELGASIR